MFAILFFRVASARTNMRKKGSSIFVFFFCFLFLFSFFVFFFYFLFFFFFFLFFFFFFLFFFCFLFCFLFLFYFSLGSRNAIAKEVDLLRLDESLPGIGWAACL